MTQFLRQLPVLLRRTDVVLELRDSRLPLTSINRNFEGASAPLPLLHVCAARVALRQPALRGRREDEGGVRAATEACPGRGGCR